MTLSQEGRDPSIYTGSHHLGQADNCRERMKIQNIMRPQGEGGLAFLVLGKEISR